MKKKLSVAAACLLCMALLCSCRQGPTATSVPDTSSAVIIPESSAVSSKPDVSITPAFVRDLAAAENGWDYSAFTAANPETGEVFTLLQNSCIIINSGGTCFSADEIVERDTKYVTGSGLAVGNSAATLVSTVAIKPGYALYCKSDEMPSLSFSEDSDIVRLIRGDDGAMCVCVGFSVSNSTLRLVPDAQLKNYFTGKDVPFNEIIMLTAYLYQNSVTEINMAYYTVTR